jgi:predicted transcriptional regulator
MVAPDYAAPALARRLGLGRKAEPVMEEVVA